MAKQALLYQLCQRGTVSTRSELMYIFEMLDPRYTLPNHPLWDFNNDVRGVANDSDAIEKKGFIDNGLFKRYVWSFGKYTQDRYAGGTSLYDGWDISELRHTYPDAMAFIDANIDIINDNYPGLTKPQFKAKARICQLVLPALRGKHIKLIYQFVLRIALRVVFDKDKTNPTASYENPFQGLEIAPAAEQPPVNPVKSERTDRNNNDLVDLP